MGADLEVFHPDHSGSELRQKHGWDKKLVIYQGQISGSNYVHLFIKAAHLLSGRRSDVDFVIVGGGDKLSEARQLAEQLGLGERLTFTDKVPHHLVPRYIAAADIAVACFEDNKQVRCKSPLKIKEYMASAKPIVASRVGDVPYMLDGCGVLVDPEDFRDLAGGIERLLNNQEEANALGRKARARAEELYSWRKSADTLLAAYDRAMHYHYVFKK